MSIRTIAGVSTSSHMVPRSSAKHCAGRDPGLAVDTRWPPATLLNHQGRLPPWPSPNAASELPTPSSFGEDRNGCACSRARSAGAGTTSRSASARSSSVRVPCEPLLRSEELPPRAGTDAGGAYSVWLCKTHLLPLCSGRRPSMPLCLGRRHRLCRTSCTTHAHPCPAACRLAEPL